ncbi:hypothetical protein ESCO_002101 [Escovopsis weberi]|uniref:BTB domain-containing protein n=1 Tax=Escovopsis weberi TaxID=150374 RepID=A0A0M8N3H0_ESCWE|nr:hypothetical protein ESCO_002101 [Escovopsis weberi]
MATSTAGSPTPDGSIMSSQASVIPNEDFTLSIRALRSREENFRTFCASMFNTDALADVIVMLGPIKLPAHSFVLASHSHMLMSSLGNQRSKGPMKLTYPAESYVQAHWRAFEYMYTGTYSDSGMPETSRQLPDDEELLKHVRVYKVAKDLQLEGLWLLALRRLKEKWARLWQSVAFTDSIRSIYGEELSADRYLRPAIVEFCVARKDKLWKMPRFQELVQEGGAFTRDLVGTLIKGDLP